MGFVRPTTNPYSKIGAYYVSAFGGMIAFCIIVGDTIPHVIKAVFPSFEDMSFLWLLTDRRAVILIFILGISFPLSLYRDIAKVTLPFHSYHTVSHAAP
jgi:amino acid permease